MKQDSEVLIAINSQGLYVIDPVNVVSHDIKRMSGDVVVGLI